MAIGSRPVKTMESVGPSRYDAGKKIRGRKSRACVNAEGIPIMMTVHIARAHLILGMIETAPQVAKLQADDAYRNPKPVFESVGPGPISEVVSRTKDVRGVRSRTADS